MAFPTCAGQEAYATGTLSFIPTDAAFRWTCPLPRRRTQSGSLDSSVKPRSWRRPIIRISRRFTASGNRARAVLW